MLRDNFRVPNARDRRIDHSEVGWAVPTNERSRGVPRPETLWWSQPCWPPLLVTGQHGAGRVAAITTDVAPHWVGGFVDWGDARVAAQADGAPAIEVGNW
jgi:hypothetical protein